MFISINSVTIDIIYQTMQKTAKNNCPAITIDKYVSRTTQFLFWTFSRIFSILELPNTYSDVSRTFANIFWRMEIVDTTISTKKYECIPPRFLYQFREKGSFWTKSLDKFSIAQILIETFFLFAFPFTHYSVLSSSIIQKYILHNYLELKLY